jgi:hypothetical protein
MPSLDPDLVPPMSEVTRILSAILQGEPNAAEQLLPLVYHELRPAERSANVNIR